MQRLARRFLVVCFVLSVGLWWGWNAMGDSRFVRTHRSRSQRSQRALWSCRRNREMARTLPAFETSGSYAVQGGAGDGAGFLILTPPLQARLAVAVSSSSVFATAQRTFAITQFAFDGRQRMIVRATNAPRSASRGDRELLIRQLVDTARSPLVRTAFVLGVRYDDDDVPFVQTWHLLK